MQSDLCSRSWSNLYLKDFGVVPDAPNAEDSAMNNVFD